MIIAFYKVFQGSEFFQASLASIYRHVDKIVIVSSDLNWFDEKGNDCEDEAREFIRKFDIDAKIILLTGTWTSQHEQQNYGWEYIQANITRSVDDFVMIIDSDEVWTDDQFEIAKKVLEDNPLYRAYGARCWVYLKYANYRVTNLDPAFLLTFVRADWKKFDGARGAMAKPWRNCKEFYFHHFNQVRFKEQMVFDKIRTSLAGDKVEGTDFQVWRKKWDNIETAKDLHPTKGFEGNWKSIEIVADAEIPEIVRNSKYYVPLKAPSSPKEKTTKINALKKRKVRALLFDLDGTLYDTPIMHWQALNQALRDFGYPEISMRDQKDKYSSKSTTYKMLEVGVKAEDSPRVKKAKDDYFDVIVRSHQWRDYAFQVLNHFRAAGYRVYVVSNNPVEYIERIGTYLGILPILDGYIGGESVAKKPSPELYITIMARELLGVTECAAFEDSEDGIKSAREAGLDVMQITDKNRGRISDIEEFLNALVNSKQT